MLESSELNEFPVEEFRSFISKEVPVYQRGPILKILEIETVTVEDFQKLGRMLAGEEKSDSLILHTGPRPSQGKKKELWQCVEQEVYNFFCTNSKEYLKERKDGAKYVSEVVPVISTAIVANFNVGLGIVTGLVTVAVMCVLKMTKNAWCEWYLPKIETAKMT